MILLNIALSGFQSQNKTSKLTEVGFANLFNYCEDNEIGFSHFDSVTMNVKGIVEY